MFSRKIEFSLCYILLYCKRHSQASGSCSGEHTAFMLGKNFFPESGFGKPGWYPSISLPGGMVQKKKKVGL
jgi:hypothetical protein